MRFESARRVAFVVAIAAACLAGGALWLRSRAASRGEIDPRTAALVAADPTSSAALLALARIPRIVASGAEVFRTSCAVCHGGNGSGVIAPNLTDRYWIHSPDPAAILKLVREGHPAQGMPAWEPILGFERARDATVFVLSLEGRNLPGKAPQGELVR